jgi:hypothetical protein
MRVWYKVVKNIPAFHPPEMVRVKRSTQYCLWPEGVTYKVYKRGGYDNYFATKKEAIQFQIDELDRQIQQKIDHILEVNKLIAQLEEERQKAIKG